MGKFNYTSKGAIISKCEKYRYVLWREWRGTHDPNNWDWIDKKAGMGTPKSCLFVMLNPSTANGEDDDATIRRCVSFAQRFNYERLEVVNLFAYRATDPFDILDMTDKDDPVGPDNVTHVGVALERAGLIIAGWGVHGDHLGQDQTMLGWLDGKKVHALGVTQDGHPRHPLYLHSEAPLSLLP